MVVQEDTTSWVAASQLCSVDSDVVAAIIELAAKMKSSSSSREVVSGQGTNNMLISL